MLKMHCAIAGERFPPDVVPPGGESEENPRTNGRLQTMIRDGVPPDSAVKNFFLALATCNTVFVNKPQDADTVDDGYFERDNEFVVGNSVFYMGNDSTPTPTPAATPSEERPSDICLELGAQAPGTIKRTPTWTDRLNNSVKFIGKR
uniref:Crinkler (CRN) n=1 Tax=Steinernema glaseri TaxID=37863 RepID=A0A1I8AJM2_9BILA